MNKEFVLDCISINNYKSIVEAQFNVTASDNCNTHIIVGKNGSGKSKLLEAISIPQSTNIKYKEICNRKYMQDKKPVDIVFSFVPRNRKNYLREIERTITLPINLLNRFRIENIAIEYFLKNNENNFTIYKCVNHTNLKFENLIYREKKQDEISEDIPQKYLVKLKDEISEDEQKNLVYKDFTENFFDSILNKIFDISIHSSLWRASENNILQNSIDLNTFINNLDSNIPLKNIFYLCGYDSKTKISNALNEAYSSDLANGQLENMLETKTTKFLRDVWKDNNFNLNFKFSIKRNPNNTYKFCIALKDDNANSGVYSIDDISDGYKQFISILLSNSIDENSINIVSIDEPELHMHPLAIMYLRDKLIDMGKENYLFFATHSPFMLDYHNSERHIKLEKIDSETKISNIPKNTSLNNDEISEELFGINTFRDFFAPHRIMVEGLSDKIIIEKGLKLVAKDSCIAITNGKGDNIIQAATYMNSRNVKNLLTILDADTSAVKNKETIIKDIGGVFNKKNVFTIQNICNTLYTGATIEDLLNQEYVVSIFNSFLKEKYPKISKYTNPNSSPIISQIVVYLRTNNINPDDKFIKELKTRIATNFDIGLKALKTKNEHLFTLCNFIKEHFKI